MLLIQKLSLTLLSIALIPVFLVAAIFYFYVHGSLHDRQLSQLVAIATIQKNRVENLIDQNRSLLTGYTSRAGLQTNVALYNQKHQTATQALLEQSVTSFKAGNVHLESVSVLDPGGMVVASTQASSMGHQYRVSSYITQGRVSNNVTDYLVRDGAGELHLYLVGPLMASGDLVGIAVLETDMSAFVALTSDYTGLGASGETMLVKRDAQGNALDVLPLRFDREAALHLTIARTDERDPATQALMKHEGTVTDGLDYRGRQVSAATRYVATADWGVVVKMDQSEAYGSLTQLGDLILVVMFILSVIIILVAFYLARLLNEPILSLAVAADKLRDGDLTARAQVMSKDEIGRLAETFNAMAENVEKVDQMKSEFVLLTSHQLRTPATAVKGFLAMVLDNYAGKLQPKQRELMEAAYTENERQISVINSILDVARLEAGQMVLAPRLHDVVAVVEASAAGQASLLAEHKQKLTIVKPQRPVMLWVDPDKLQLAIDNLIHNAIKYSDRGTQITVAVEHQPTTTIIEVRDHGIGIARRDLPRLFKRFSRIAGPRTVNVQGAGLGLYLAQKLIALHGGTIEVQSHTGVGTRFTITLPNVNKDPHV